MEEEMPKISVLARWRPNIDTHSMRKAMPIIGSRMSRILGVV